ncbi:MAG TPA: FAD-binding oxidoreductase [Thermoplasmata archaeon]|nr:FAD-binding oxidoreductase [Thermoplasmata archaeon]
MPLARDASEALRAADVGPITEEPDALLRFASDASHLTQRPAAAVAPRNRDEVQHLVQWARRWKVPLVGRGGGSSLDGESVPPPGGVVVDFSGWNAIVEIDEADRWVRVGPGVVNRDLHRALASHGLFFPPNPGSWTTSTIGGNAATNASGPRSFRYGSTRSWVRGLEVVLGSGELLRVGHRTRKASTGPDLLGFLVGSEGTLGLFTEICLALAPAPERRIGLVLPVPEELSFRTTLPRLLASPAPAFSALEYLDRPTAAALSRFAAGRLPGESALLLLELESSGADEDLDLERVAKRLVDAGFTGEPVVYPDADQLWTLRGQSGEAIEADGVRIHEDVAVPWSRLDELIAGTRALAARHDVPVRLFGHLGDGNLHPGFVVDPSSERARGIRRDLVQLAKRLGGTISAEHGVGALKAEYLALEHGAVGVSVLEAFKRRCDPDGIMNPGKLYPALGSAEGTGAS